MRAISLTQPWATLVAIGEKRIETRSWWTNYRGVLAIHASKRWSREDHEIAQCEPFRTVLWDAGYRWIAFTRGLSTLLPFGAIIAVVDLIDVSDSYRMALQIRRYPSDWPTNESQFGDYSPGRFAWIFGNIRRIEPPITCSGALGLWSVSAGVADLIRERLASPVVTQH